MIKKISYVISQRFQWLFIATYIVSQGVLSAVQILQQTHTHYSPWLRPDTAVILLALEVMPMVIAIIAALVLKKGGLLRRVFYGAVIGYAWLSIWSVVIMNLPGLYYKPEYFSNGSAALVAATVLVALALALDRWWQPIGVYRYWRLVGLGLVVAFATLIPVYSSIANGGGYREVSIVLGMVALSILVLGLFRQLPWPQRVKRVLLLAVLINMTGFFASYTLSLVTRSNMVRYWWIDPLFDLVVYCVGAWLLWPKAANDGIEQ